jgi:large subunit ribosomal protein L22
MSAKTGYMAQAKFLMIAPSKMRRVASNIRKKPYSEAVAILEALPHKAAGLIRKVVTSAAANALVANEKLDEDMLFIKELRIEEGPRVKRLWPRARGRADRLLKRMSHVRVILDEIGSTGENDGTES